MASPIALPFQSTAFLGRETEIAEITALLNSPECRLLTLTGMGGTGKTRLAIAVAQRMGDQFPNGIYFTALQPLQMPDQIISAVIESLNLQIARDPQAELLSWLRDKRLLLVLDNFEHLLAGAPLLTDMLAASPGLKILVTSRDPLRLTAEWVRHIQGLSYPAKADAQTATDYDAVNLFVERARQKQGDLNLTADYPHIVRICHLVDGMPLALELAAGWVETLSCEAIAAELAQSRALLATNTQDVPSRHQSMQAIFDQSWQRLTVQEQAALCSFSLFWGGCTLHAARQIIGASLPLLAGLVEKSLLRHNGNRYDLHELLRQYAGEQLVASGRMQTAREAHAAYYVDFLRDQWQVLHGSQQVRALEAIEVEFDNIRSAWQYLIEQCDAARLSVMVHPLWLYADLRARYHDMLILFRQAEAALQPFAGDSAIIDRAIGLLMATQGLFYLPIGDYQEGRAIAERGLEILLPVGTAEDVIAALCFLCMLADRLDDFPSMQRYSEQASQLAMQQDDIWVSARAAYVSACVQLSDCLEDYEESKQTTESRERAIQAVEKARSQIEASGEPWMRGTFCNVTAWLAVLLGDYDEALRLCRRGVALCEEIGQIVIIAQAHHNLGLILRDLNDQDGAEFHYLQALRVLIEQGGYGGDLISILISVAQLRTSQGDVSEAAELATMMLRHPASYLPSCRRASELLHELEAAMPPAAFAAAQMRGRQLDLTQVIRDLLRDQPADAALLAEPLTAREREILGLLAQGLSNAQIAAQLFLTPGTVKWYLNRVYQKLEVNGRAQAVIRARHLHLIDS